MIIMMIMGLFRKNHVERKNIDRLRKLDELEKQSKKVKSIFKDIGVLENLINKKLENARKSKQTAKTKGLSRQLKKLEGMSEEAFKKLEVSRKKLESVNKELIKFWEDYNDELRAIKEVYASL